METVVSQGHKSESQERWKQLRDVFVPSVGEKQAVQSGSSERWDFVRQAVLDEPVSYELPRTEDVCRANLLASTSSQLNEVVAAELQLSAKMESAQTSSAARREATGSRDGSLTTETETSNAPTFILPVQKEWGSKEEVAELNRDIQECLEIEQVPNPGQFFTESVDGFESVGQYYVHIMKRLEPVDIDLFESLSSHLGDEHPLVKDMFSILSNEPQRTYMAREPTVVRTERQEAGAAIGVPGVREFAEECRSFSWVIRTGPRVKNRGTETSAEGNNQLDTIQGSIMSSSRYVDASPKREGPIVCPGLPLSFDGCAVPPERVVPSSTNRKQKKTLWSHVMDCFCFAS